MPYPRRATLTLAERLWRKVNKDGPIVRAELGPCWEWTGTTNHAGYGIINLGRRGDGIERTHRVSWSLAHGSISDGLFVLHRCDNPPCIRPEHLFLGTDLENKRDAAAKGRMQRGEKRPLAKLTEDDVRRIRRECPAIITYKEMSRILGVSSSIVKQAGTRDTWKHVE